MAKRFSTYLHGLRVWDLHPRAGMIDDQDRLELTRYNQGWVGHYVDQYSPWELKKLKTFFKQIRRTTHQIWVRDEYREDEKSDLHGIYPTVGRAVWFESGDHAKQFISLTNTFPERSLIYAFDAEIRIDPSILIDKDVNHILLMGEEKNILCMEDRRDLLAIVKLASK